MAESAIADMMIPARGPTAASATAEVWQVAAVGSAQAKAPDADPPVKAENGFGGAEASTVPVPVALPFVDG
jgi:hypothetical protein